jgi:hypothetical protein
VEQIFQAHGAVGVKLFGLAPVGYRVHARAARVAVHKIIIIIPPDAANAALVAVVVIPLNAVVKEVAHGAKIGGELDAATKACLRDGLLHSARCAYHLFDRVPVHFVRLGVVVAVAAHIRLVAARGHYKASAHVVLATNCMIVVVVHIQYKQCAIIHLNDFW